MSGRGLAKRSEGWATPTLGSGEGFEEERRAAGGTRGRGRRGRRRRRDLESGIIMAVDAECGGAGGGSGGSYSAPA